MKHTVLRFPAVTLLLALATWSHAAGWTLTGWNNLGMHCMDDDYSVFSILPPFNTVNAQLIDPQGHLVTNPAGFTLTYEGVADPSNSINTTSAGKTNFWDYVGPLFGANLPVDTGLAGKKMPGVGNSPQPMDWDANFKWWTATGIPIAPTDDAGLKNTYPLMKLTATNASGTTLASVNVVLPVSDEVDCRTCHASGSNDAAKPVAGWVNDPDGKRDHRLNILRLHDEKSLANTAYLSALGEHGYRSSGLYDTVVLDGRSILCANCHASEALGTGGSAGVKPLTASVHGHHAAVVDLKSGLTLDATANRTACYQCHPGSTTKCLRGAMGAAVATDGTLAMQCQSCHGSMSDVGATTRTGWLDEPNCQACHTGTATSNSGRIVFTSVFDAPGHMRVPANTTFATNPNTPAEGKSLYRFSTGHGKLQCEACHGSTHAEFPTWSPNDNLYSTKVQGHVGKLAECGACHNPLPNTINGGPHGLHPLGGTWASRHGDLIELAGVASCQSCHGANLSGTRLSRAQGARTLALEERGVKTFWHGQTIGCYDCHNGPNGEDGPGRNPPRVKNASYVAINDRSKAQTIHVKSGTAGGAISLRVVSQPLHGTVGVSGLVATYFPEPGYTGTDRFTFAAADTFVESNLGKAKIRVFGSYNGQPDLVLPRLRGVRPINRARVSAAGFNIHGAAIDNFGVVRIEFAVGNGAWQQASGTTSWSAAIAPAAPGRLLVKFRATDLAGNQSAPIQRVYFAR